MSDIVDGVTNSCESAHFVSAGTMRRLRAASTASIAFATYAAVATVGIALSLDASTACTAVPDAQAVLRWVYEQVVFFPSHHRLMRLQHFSEPPIAAVAEPFT